MVDVPIEVTKSLVQLKIAVLYSVRGDAAGATRREESKNIGSNYLWTVLEYCRECEGKIDAGHFSVMVVNGKNIVSYDRNNFQCATVLSAWKRSWAVLRNWCPAISINTRFAGTPLTRCD